ncbi:MAG: formamidopyrimidine DNA glycosylase [Ectothiorhodospiraceae bacterium]|nr:formamidopyrimidine DNA glycosylase [Ectothiorhodospiraceae bacterium]
MPEGDTIHKLAGALDPLLRGKVLRRAVLRRSGPHALDGRRVESVVALGKHLLIHLDDARTLRTHLGMHGSWHRYRPGETWRKPARQASLVLETDDVVAVCFNAREVEVEARGGFTAREREQRLGPDLADPTFDAAAAVGRARERLAAETPLLDVLLDQRVACGLGNVYKNELLFLARIAPQTPLGAVEDTALEVLYDRAAALLGRNTGGGPRTTRFVDDGRGRLWVYRRAGQPCLVCAATVRRARLGRGLRSTYWCPRCQPELRPTRPRPER